GACHRIYEAAAIDAADAGASCVADIDVVLLVSYDPYRNVQPCSAREVSISGETDPGGSRECGNRAGGCDASHERAHRRSDVQVARSIETGRPGIAELSADRGPIVAATAELPIARYRADDSGGRNFANAIVGLIRNIHVARGIGSDAIR